jgi:TolB-like protein
LSFFSELKRRNVFRVVVAYVVACWLLLQVTDVLIGILGLPGATGKFVFLALVLGFVPAVVVSWVYELTPEGLKKDTGMTGQDTGGAQMGRKLDRITFVLALIAIGMIVFDRLIPEEATVAPNEAPVAASPIQAESTSPETKATDRTKSLAVLPFANVSPDPDNEYFADGISEELLNVLVDIEELRVPSRTSSFAFKGMNRDIREIASQLDVDHILEGSVRKSGDRVRITAQLIDVSTDTHLWSETYDRKLEDIFAIQDEIAGHIIEALKVSLALEIQHAPTTDVEAYTLYLQGRELFRRRSNEEHLLEADRVLREAVKRDPQFADAWAMLAMVQVTLPGYQKVAWTDFVEVTIELAERALAIDSDQTEAKLALANVMFDQGRHHEALETFESIIEQHPRHSQARLWLAIALYRAGFLTQAFEQADIAVKLDPVHGTMLDWLARTALASGKPELVVDLAERAIQLGREQGRVPLVQFFIGQGNFSDFEPFITNNRQSWEGFRWAFDVRNNPGLLPESMAWADQFEREGGMSAYFVLFFLMVAESSDNFFDHLNQVHTVDDTIDVVVWIPAARHHRQSDAMKTWARTRGYEALWRVRGWPDLCRPVGEDDWVCD